MNIRKESSDEALRALGRLAAEAEGGRSSEGATLVVATAALVEGYVDGILRGLIEGTPYRTHRFLEVLYAEMEDRIFQSWGERFRWLRQGFAVSLDGSAQLQNLDVLIQLRNACVHGNGSLTERQSRDVVALIALERDLQRLLDVAVVRRRLHFAPTTAAKAVDVARSFVLAFDANLHQVHGSLRL